jgi:hypothetical protein
MRRDQQPERRNLSGSGLPGLVNGDRNVCSISWMTRSALRRSASTEWRRSSSAYGSPADLILQCLDGGKYAAVFRPMLQRFEEPPCVLRQTKEVGGLLEGLVILLRDEDDIAAAVPFDQERLVPVKDLITHRLELPAKLAVRNRPQMSLLAFRVQLHCAGLFR